MEKLNFCNDWVVTNIPRRHHNDLTMRREVTLPYDVTIHTVPRDPNSRAGSHQGCWGGGEYEYTKTFYIPAEDKDKVLMLEFEGVYMNAMVYVNEEMAGKCLYGYLNFYVPLNDHLHFGADNVVRVVVKTGALPNSRWYDGSGIYRPVYLYKAERLHIPENGVKFTTEHVSDGNATVRVETTMRNANLDVRFVTLETALLAPDGTEVAKDSVSVHICPGKNENVRQRLFVENAQLWDEKSPNLYTVVSRLIENSKQCDETSFTTGIRTLTLNARDGLRVNGKEVKLRGACIHHTSGFIGSETFACEEERKVRMLKEAGFNAIRIAHQPCSKDMLAACDKLGVYLMEESYDTWSRSKVYYDYALNFHECWEKDVEAFVDKDYNHPCVVLYCIGNEIPELAMRDGAELARKVANKVRSLDDTRFITNAINAFFCAMGDFDRFKTGEKAKGDINETLNLMGRSDIVLHPDFINLYLESTTALDVIGYNYLQGRYDKDCTELPNRIFVGTEMFPQDVSYNWTRTLKYSNLLGDFTWSGMEYLGEAGVVRHQYDEKNDAFYGQYPHYYSGTGDITLAGDRRTISYFREIVFGLRKDPYIAVWLPQYHDHQHYTSIWGWSDTVHNWRWPGFEGKPISIEVYSDSEEVELLINGKSQGRQKIEDFRTTFETVYEPGEVVAISYTSGVETGRQVLVSAGDSLKLNVEIDKTTLQPGAQDLAHISFTFADDNGLTRMDVDRKIRLSVEGAGELIGFGSDDPVSTEEMFESERTTYRGRALAFIRSAVKGGEIRIGVDCEGFDYQEFTINVQ